MIRKLTRSLQHVLDAMNLGVLVETSDRTIVYTNKKFLDIFNIPGRSEDMVGVDCKMAAEQSKGFFKDPQKFIKDSNEYPVLAMSQEDTVETADGRFYLRKYVPIQEEDEIVQHVWTYEDVTALTAKQNELNEQRVFFAKILNEIPADIAIFSPQHKYLFVNKMGIKNDDIRKWIIGKDDYEYVAYRGFDTKVADIRRERFLLAKESRQSMSWVDELTKPDGTKDYVLRIFYPYINADDELEFVIGYGVNITDQKKKELEIAHAKERFSSLVSSLKDGVFHCTFDGDVLMSNEALMTMVNDVIPIEEGKPTNIFDIVHREDIGMLMKGAEELKRTKQPQRGVVRLKPNIRGAIKYVDTYVWLQHDEEHGTIFTGRISDITEQVEKQVQMKEMIEKEKELNKLKSNFIHITSHELRTPLSVILSSAEILEMIAAMEKEDQPEGMEPSSFTGSIVKEVTRITEILDEMLMVGRIEKGSLNFKPEEVDLTYYLNALAQELYIPYDDGRNLNIDIQLATNRAVIDMKLMRHAVTNLLNNAFKYSLNKPAPTLRAYNRGDDICIEVKDNGIGIPQQDVEMLFNSFYRASNVGNISGNGIGLMVVEYVMKMHSGTVEVDSKENEGTTFTLVIPKDIAG